MEYEATIDGMIIGKRGRFLKLVLKKNGYLHFSKSDGYGNPNQTLVHRFVWEFFNGPISKELVIDHIDGDRTNNKLKNLQLLSRKENSSKGKEVILDGFLVWQIKKLLHEGGISQEGISKIFKVSPQTVCDIKMGRRWAGIGDIH